MKTSLVFLLLIVNPLAAVGQTVIDLGWSEGYQAGDGPTQSHLPFLWDLRKLPEKGDLILETESGHASFLLMSLQNRKGQWSEIPLTWPLTPELSPGEKRALSWERILKTLRDDNLADFSSSGLLRLRIEVWGRGEVSSGHLILTKATLESRSR